MQVKTLLLAAAGVTSVLAGTSNLKEKPGTAIAKITGDTTSALAEKLEDQDTPHPPKSVDTPTWTTTHKPHVPTLTLPIEARDVTMMVDPSTHPHLQPNTRPSESVLPLCIEGGKVLPAKSLLEPWCSNANKQFHCQFCSQGYQLPSSVGNSLTKDLIEQDFEVWIVKQTLGDLTRITKDDVNIQSRDTLATNPTLPQPPKPLDTRDQHDICCYFNGVQTCYVCDAGQEPPSAVDSEVTVWSRKQALGSATYEYEMVTDGKSGVANDIKAKICCVQVLGHTYCFECPSATSATEVSLAAATAANFAIRDSSDIKPAQCCWTNGLIVFGCHDCDKTQSGSVNNDGRAVLVSVTTKAPTTATKPMPTLSFPSTLTHLPQVTPPASAIVEKRSDQTKCCNTHDVVRCHNCTAEEEGALSSVAVVATTMEQNQCCVHLGDELICHPCPTGITDTTGFQKPSTTLSVAKRQVTYDFHMSCSWSGSERGHKCGKKDKLTVIAPMCENICQCSNLGSMHCETPSGSSCTDGETTDYCKKGSPFFGCACSHQAEHPPKLESTYPPRAA